MSNDGQIVCTLTGKIRYDSTKDAHNAIVGVQSRRKQGTNRPNETPYYCAHCDGWHLGRRWTEVKGRERYKHKFKVGGRRR